jgi:hypothetical protein
MMEMYKKFGTNAGLMFTNKLKRKAIAKKKRKLA